MNAMAWGRDISVALFPLSGMHLFPSLMQPLYIFEERYKLMIDRVLEQEGLVALIWAEHPGWANHDFTDVIAGVGKVKLLHRYPDNRKNIVLMGSDRISILGIEQEIPFYTARARLLPKPTTINTDIIPSAIADLKEIVQETLKAFMPNRPHLLNYVTGLSSLDDLVNFAGYYFLQSHADKQWLLEQNDLITKTNFVMGQLRKLLGKTTKGATVLKFPSPENIPPPEPTLT